MTAHRSFKRLVRSRMEKTGESYTAARLQLLQAGDEPQRISLATSDETIRERTGRGWEEWFDLLDEAGAADMTHRETARWLAEREGLHPLAWNVQAVVGGYEQGPPRPPGRRARGRLHRHRLEDRRRPGRAALRGVRRRGPARALAARRRAARAHHDRAALGALRLGRRRRPASTSPSPPRARRRAPRRCRTSGSPDGAEAERMKAFWRERVAGLKEVLES